MKKIISKIKIFIFIGVLTATTSCGDFMATDTARLLPADENLINSPNDTVFSIIGILSNVQRLADRYVLLGELRGDLMNVTDKTRSELRDLNNFAINPASSEFSNVRDYYAIINNCNYFIARADTNVTDRGYKPFISEIAAAKSIRAWTYMQLVSNYGKAYYFENPILTVKESVTDYPEYDQSQMIDVLISELTPIVDVRFPKYLSKFVFVDPYFVLGDLYLWRASFTHDSNDYERAATAYASLMVKGKYRVTAAGISWDTPDWKNYSDYWTPLIRENANSLEYVSVIKTDLSTNQPSSIFSISNGEELALSKSMEDLFASQVYCFRDDKSNLKYTDGDLRAKVSTKYKIYGINDGSNSSFYDESKIPEKSVISKLTYPNVMVYRTGLLYLRYAEAVNRAGKPALAYAVLKYGLNSATLQNIDRVPASELADGKGYVGIFAEDIFNDNVGIHDRGCGKSAYNDKFVISNFTRYVNLKNVAGKDSIDKRGNPVLVPTTDPIQLRAAKNDSINYVEEAICDELALETGFEGNRFHDLMRISNHRNDPSFLAEKVAKKHLNNTAIKNYLMNTSNWFIPVRK